MDSSRVDQRSPSRIAPGPSLDADVLLWRDREGNQRRFTLDDAVHTRDLVRGTPWMVPGRRHGQYNRTGDFFFSTTQRHVPYASLAECALFLLLDHQQTVEGILAQPFKLRFRRNNHKLSHIPDCFVRRTNGDEEVWDVRPYSRIDGRLKEGAALTREFCRKAGIAYYLHDGIDLVVRRNLEWLHAYSDARYAPPRTRDRRDALAFFAAGRTIAEALTIVNVPPVELRCWVFHLLWIGELDFDHRRPLDSHTTITRRK